jgi:hypothetical protein
MDVFQILDLLDQDRSYHVVRVRSIASKSRRDGCDGGFRIGGRLWDGAGKH